MSIVLQVSDPHFGTEQAPVVEALAALAREQRPDLVLLSGDITQRARPGQFRAARAFVDRLGAPVQAIPGNHDIPLLGPGRLVDPYRRYRAAFGAELEPVFDSDDLLVRCVNTTRPWRHKHGEVSSAQVARVAAALARARPAQLRIVVVHQPAVVVRDADRPDRLRGAEAALAAWAAAGADLVLGGHIHLPYVTEVPALTRPLWVVQAGTAVSSRVRDGVPNSVNLLRTGVAAPGHCIVEQWDHSASARRFVRATSTEIALDRRAPPHDGH